MKYCLVIVLFFYAHLLGAQKISGTWNGLLDVGAIRMHVVFHIQKDSTGRTVCLMDSPDQSVKGIPATLLFLSEDSLSINVPEAQILYTGRLWGNTIRGTFTQGGSFPLDLEYGALKHDRPQLPEPPYPYKTEEIEFHNVQADAVLSGTLTYPVDYREDTKVPVLIMISGSGPQDRDSELFDHKPFLVIADYLARNGIATLRYDDRAVGKSTGKQPTATTWMAAEDALAGVAFLRKMDLFAPVGVLGHSEGATAGFMMAARKAIDFLVSMAGIGVRGDEVMFEQAQRISDLSGQEFPFSKEEFKKMVLENKNPWLDFFMAYDPVPDIRKTTCPVFVLNGDNDVQVISSQNLTAIEASLPANEDNKIKVYPGLNHLFQECTTGLPLEYANIEQTISPEVLQDIADWVKSLSR